MSANLREKLGGVLNEAGFLKVQFCSNEAPFRPAGVVASRLRLAPRLLRVGHRRGSLDFERDGRSVVVGAAGVQLLEEDLA